jgi:hypothetical protein
MNDQNPPRKPGRPTLRTPEIENILIEAAETGAPIKACCATARIGYETFRAWCISDPELAFQFYQARERGRVNALSILQQAASKDWRAAAEWLRLAHRSEYSTRAEISVEGAPKQDEGIVIDSGMLTRLQGASQQTLESIHGQEPDKQNGFPEQQLT